MEKKQSLHVQYTSPVPAHCTLFVTEPSKYYENPMVWS